MRQGVRKDSEAYERHKQRAAKRWRDMAEAGRDLGDIPPPEKPDRRDEGGKSFRFFLETYFPERFPLAWSPDHLKVIALVERTVRDGGLFALAMPRGSGKTTICECAALWAVLYGYHSFVSLIGSTGDLAARILASIKSELENNDILAADFPEVCIPVRELDGKANRCAGQTHKGSRTLIQWRKNLIVLPSIPGSVAAESVIMTFPILGAIRGVKYTRSDGVIVRPTLVIPDDPQTDESAPSPLQCSRRLKVMNGAILKLAGPGKRIAALCPCTVIVKDDMADKLLDREINPHWHGERCKALYAFPNRMDLWKQWAVIRADSLRAGGEGREAREFYAANREQMDEGALVAWPQRFDPGDLSALETAMRSFFEDKYSFFAEQQNEPIDELRTEGDLKPADIVTRFSGRPRGIVPVWASKLTSFIDVQERLLFWLVAAWRPEDFTGTVIDYGTWPGQNGRRYFTYSDAQHLLEAGGAGVEAKLRRGLLACEGEILGRAWQREDGSQMRISRCLIDSGYQMNTIFEHCRVSPYASIVMPSRGVPIKATSKPMHEWNKAQGDQKGFHWFISPQHENSRLIRWIRVDVNFWKSFCVERLRQAIGDPGALTLFGQSRTDADHDMIADHLCAERGVPVEAMGRRIVEWQQPANQADNHWWDCLVGAAAAASVEGSILAGQTKPRDMSKRPSLADLKHGRTG